MALTVLAGLVLVGSAMAGWWTEARAAGSGTYRDEFTTAGYAGSDGTIDWSSSPWVEVGDDDSASSGRIRVESVPECTEGNCLRIRHEPRVRVQRTADLEGATSALLTFDWVVDSLPGSDVVFFEVAASPDGQWVTLMGFGSGDISEGQAQTFDITAWISPTTTFRFRVPRAGETSGLRLFIDNVQIEASDPGPARQDPPGFTLIGDRVTISEAVGASVENPMNLALFVASSAVPSGFGLGDIVVFHDRVPVAECEEATGMAIPDPCVAGREAVDEDFRFDVLTSEGIGDWEFGVPAEGDGPDGPGGPGDADGSDLLAESLMWSAPPPASLDDASEDPLSALADGAKEAFGVLAIPLALFGVGFVVYLRRVRMIQLAGWAPASVRHSVPSAAPIAADQPIDVFSAPGSETVLFRVHPSWIAVTGRRVAQHWVEVRTPYGTGWVLSR